MVHCSPEQVNELEEEEEGCVSLSAAVAITEIEVLANTS